MTDSLFMIFYSLKVTIKRMKRQVSDQGKLFVSKICTRNLLSKYIKNCQHNKNKSNKNNSNRQTQKIHIWMDGKHMKEDRY
jgi:hypothetical protein